MVRIFSAVFNRIEKKRFNALKVFIKTDVYIAWCSKHSLPLNGDSRSDYVSEILSKHESN